VRPLHEANIQYVVAGSVAAMHFSEPRLTLDVDIPLFISPKDVGHFADYFSEPNYYCPPGDVLAVEASRECRGHFSVIHIPTGLKADFYPGNRDETLVWAWQNKRIEETESGPIYLAPPEYVMLWKLIFYREGGSEKHLRDIARMRAVNPSKDWDRFLLEQIADHGLQKEWDASDEI